MRHLAGNDHNHSQHLVDHSICQEVGIFSCSHPSYPSGRKSFFTTKEAYICHNNTHHPPLSKPTSRTLTPPPPQPTNTYTVILPYLEAPAEDITTNDPPLNDNIQLCHQFFSPIDNSIRRDDQRPAGIQHIASTYCHDPPDFRSTWSELLKGNNRIKFQQLTLDIIRTIIAASIKFDPLATNPLCTTNPAPFW